MEGMPLGRWRFEALSLKRSWVWCNLATEVVIENGERNAYLVTELVCALEGVVLLAPEDVSSTSRDYKAGRGAAS